MSLYGKRLAPDPRALEGLDALVVDLQDVGSRYYTFVWTMALAMRGAARAALPVVVLDRPNPLGGERLEGNMPDPRFASFVGLYPLPTRHGMTIGELAGYLNDTHGFGCDLTVVPMLGWRRAMRWEDTGLPWVAPSPNMPTPDTARVYPGGCLVEGTNLSEGRGTTRPFEWIGAPFLDGARLERALTRRRLPGARFRAIGFEPAFHKWKGERCGGVQVHVTRSGPLQARRDLRRAPRRGAQSGPAALQVAEAAVRVRAAQAPHRSPRRRPVPPPRDRARGAAQAPRGLVAPRPRPLRPRAPPVPAL